jgi:hypothetical protein
MRISGRKYHKKFIVCALVIEYKGQMESTWKEVVLLFLFSGLLFYYVTLRVVYDIIITADRQL